jgi:hypothetical protein
MSEIVIEKIVRPERQLAGAWLEVIASNLDYHRAAFLWKCYWLQYRLAGTPAQFPPYRTYVTADGGEWYDEADPTPAKDVYTDYLAACQSSREVFAQGTEKTARIEPNPEFGDTDLRFILEHVIEEYARHVGHADLLREALDGTTGE